MPTQPSSDALLQFLSASPTSVTVRLGLQIRAHGQVLDDKLLLPARYVRIQVASPPPPRVDGSPWEAGLTLSDGSQLDPDRPPLAPAQVVPVLGIAPLGPPHPNTLVHDQWLEVAMASIDQRDQPQFRVSAVAKQPGDVLQFISVQYPRPTIDDVEYDTALVAYYSGIQDLGFRQGRELTFQGKATTAWIAVSLERFFPQERASADYIVAVPKPQAA